MDDFENASDEELASAAYVYATRAKLGDREAAAMAARLDAVLKARLGDTPSSHAPLEAEPQPKRKWWQLFGRRT